jgi:hypothetical protein
MGWSRGGGFDEPGQGFPREFRLPEGRGGGVMGRVITAACRPAVGVMPRFLSGGSEGERGRIAAWGGPPPELQP